MTWKILFKTTWTLIMLMFLTSINCFAQNKKVNREAYVKAAYEEFIPLLYSFAVNDRFLNSLTPDEKKQFELVGRFLIKTKLRFGPPTPPGGDRTSNHVDFKLRFSSNNEDFILNPGEPARTAKMAGDIWFNLNVINNPNVSFGILDAFQILFHEFGHKIGEQKDQALIDSVAAKLRQQLTPYTREVVLNDQTRVSTVVLPYITMAQRYTTDFQFQPIIIIDHQGQAALSELSVPSYMGSLVSFQEQQGMSQVYARTTMTPKINLFQGGLRFEWQVSTRHTFVAVEDGFNFANLLYNLDKAKFEEKVDPMIENSRAVEIISAEILNGIAKGEYASKIAAGYWLSQHIQQYRIANENSRWLQNLRPGAVRGNQQEFTTIIESAEPIKSASVMGLMDDDLLKFTGKVQPINGNIYQLNFEINTEGSKANTLSLRSVALNNQDQWDLPEVVDISIRQNNLSKSLRPGAIALANEKSQWLPVQDIPTTNLITDRIGWRFFYQDPSVDIEKVELMWLAVDDISKNGRSYGTRIRPIFETIEKKNIRHQTILGATSVEFFSDKASQLSETPQIARDGFVMTDTGGRMMARMSVTDKNHNIYQMKNISLRSGWKSGFEIKPKKTIIRCEKLFMLSPT